jgi:hypothetical protein
MTADDAGAVWVTSELLPDGHYTAAVAFTDDRSVALDEPAAVRYTLAILDAVQSAEHDAAVLTQLHNTLGLDEKTAAEFLVHELRPARRALRETGTPLTLVPGVSHRDRRGFLTVHVDGQPVGQWELTDAREHARYVLEALLAVEYDTAYHGVLTELLDLDDGRARNVVEDIGNHRTPL